MLKLLESLLKIFKICLKQRNNMVLATALMMGKTQKFKNGVITIGFTKEYNFHKQRLEKEEYRKTINESIFRSIK